MAIARLRTYNRKVEFQASNWMNNRLVVLPSGIPINYNEIGPHKLPLTKFYETSVYKISGSNLTREIGLTIIHNKSTGYLTIFKAARAPSFDGVVLIEAY